MTADSGAAADFARAVDPRGSSAGSASGEPRLSSAGAAGAALSGGRDRQGGEAPLRGLYSDVIRERWRRPRRRGELPGAAAVAEDVNPLCGDRVRLMLALEGGRVRAARFVGDSCAISTASADVLAEMVEGRTAAEARRIETADILDVLQTDVRPTRMRCVTLPLSVLAAALDGAGP
ncbi:MAG TPA: iron-sulfur cluster assembly scaffold protein [Candidatus Binatia bacterium]|nr:iron-sulfur cluster assembly scaffold protein [Candidatus Binatia bacterium]